jgi:5-methylcytosine-specific restriction endonuclease McrA
MARLFACAGCGRTYPPPRRRDRCPTCEKEYYRERRKRRGSTTARGLGHQHEQLRERVLAEESRCWLCGEPARPDDPLVADHVVPRAAGGETTRSNLRAAHGSCNSRRGAGGGQGTRRDERPTDPATRFSRRTLVNMPVEDEGPLIG